MGRPAERRDAARAPFGALRRREERVGELEATTGNRTGVHGFAVLYFTLISLIL